MSERVEVKLEILNWAYLKVSNREKLHHQFSKLSEWLTGVARPTFNQLEKFATATSTPLGYFFLDEIPCIELPIPHYRKLEESVSSEPSQDLIDTVHAMQRRQDIAKEYYDEFVGEQLDFVGSYESGNPEGLAFQIMSLLNVEEEWYAKVKTQQEALKFIIEQCEKKRILVMLNGVVGSNTRRNLNVDEFRGFVLVDKVCPVIFINAKDSKSAQLFTLIHEVAHILVGSSAIVEASPLNDLDVEVEKLCNQAAAEFLCPSRLFVREWNKNQTTDRFKTVASYFKVSPIVVGRRALDLGMISKSEFYEFYDEYKFELSRVKKNDSGGNFYLTTRMKLGTAFSNIVFYQVKTGKLQYTDAYRVTGMNRNSFQNYMSQFYEWG